MMDLRTTLEAILDDSGLLAPIRDAEIAFDHPADSYNPNKNAINLFLYDVRENIEFRSNEPVVEWQGDVATWRRYVAPDPPRLYLTGHRVDGRHRFRKYYHDMDPGVRWNPQDDTFEVVSWVWGDTPPANVSETWKVAPDRLRLPTLLPVTGWKDLTLPVVLVNKESLE